MMMGHDKDFFSPEEIDAQIEQRLSAHSPSTSGDHLLHDLQKLARSEQQLDSRSLAHIWQRVQEKREHADRFAEHELYSSFQSQHQRSEEKVIERKEKSAMEEETSISGGMNSSVPLTKTRTRLSPLRLVGLSLVAAVALLTILSFTLFSGVLQSAHQVANKASSTLTGAQAAPQQKAFSSGKLVCSVALDVLRAPQLGNPYTLVDWPTQGKIDALSSNYNFTTFSAQDCSKKSTKPTQVYEVWSPDGKKVVREDSSSTTGINILDANGHVITGIPDPTSQLGTTVGPIVWSSDSRKLIVLCQDLHQQGSVKSVDATNGNTIKTLMKIPGGNEATNLSPGGKYIIVKQLNSATQRIAYSIWDVNTGKKVSTLPLDDGVENFTITAFSPDSSLIAVSGKTINIYSTADGKLVTSFVDHDAAASPEGGLVWSPNGQYLAESVNSINIYDIQTQKIVATFGKVDVRHVIIGLAWSPNGMGLVSSTDQVQDDGHSQTPVNVWALN